MPTPFDNLSISAISAALNAATPVWIAINRQYYDGDHWGKSGEFWVGPLPSTTDPNSALTVGKIRRAFASSNKVLETTSRHTGGVVGHEIPWSFTVRRPLDEGEQPTVEEGGLIKEAEAVLTEWWDERGLYALFQEVATTLLLAGRSSLRLFVPRGQLQERADGTRAVPPGDLRTSLFRVFTQHPESAQATLATDQGLDGITSQDTMAQIGIYAYEEQGHQRVELTYLDGDMTVIRIIGQEGEVAMHLPLDGHLTLHEVQRPALITEQVRQQQNHLNRAYTMMGHNIDTAGFVERVLLNAQMPGEWVDDASVAGGKRFVPGTQQIGPNTTNYVMGAPIYDSAGNVTGYTNPTAYYRDPAPVATFRDTIGQNYRAILEETDQLHALISGDAVASGESRKQARADFEKSLFLSKAQIDRLGRWLLETALSMASVFSGHPHRFAGLRAIFECRVDTGPISADEMRLIHELSGKKQLLAVETAMGREGVEDTTAESKKIETEQAARQAMLSPALQVQTGVIDQQDQQMASQPGQQNGVGVPAQ